MNDNMREGFFPSANQKDNIYYRAMMPKNPPCGIVLVLHGMRSHSGRYLSFLEFLCEHDFAVYAYDHAGHGRSVAEGGLYGSFAEGDGDVVLVKDLQSMVDIIRKRFRHLPLFVFGHSLGSFVLRAYMASHKDTLDGAIISGTCERIQASYFKRRKLEKLVKKAGRAPSDAVEKMMVGVFDKQFSEAGGWVTTNPAALAKKAGDPSGHPMCADGYYDMFRLMQYISSDDWIKEVPKNLPLFFISGERDPVGGMGKGVADIAEMLDEAGVSDLTCRIYKGEKHEIIGSLSDAIAKEETLSWLNDKTEAAVALRRTHLFG
ncbi:MAG: alpha/beta fold hydrolase [Clostridia bacterium]|nr:alpha/beta fold hydrolase [Clostridia bacterium]